MRLMEVTRSTSTFKEHFTYLRSGSIVLIRISKSLEPPDDECASLNDQDESTLPRPECWERYHISEEWVLWDDQG